MRFKVGDKVRIVKSLTFPDLIGNIYEVTVVEPQLSSFSCRIKSLSGSWNCLMFEHEIEKVKVVTKNQQLLFSFMEQ